MYTEAQCEENIRKFTTDLNNMVLKAKTESIDLKTRLHSPRLISWDLTPLVALENLKLLEEMIQFLVEKAKNYLIYQEKFKNTMTQSTNKRVTKEM
jgi:hypothetical protein